MTRIDQNSAGVFVISATPFHPDGEIDWHSLDRLTDSYFEDGADGLAILGMMGEAPKMTQPEAIEIARRVIGRAEGRPIVAGVSAPGLAAIRDLSRAVMDLGAAGAMVAPPSALNTDPAIHAYYGQVTETLGADIPVVLQDFPLATTVKISDDVLSRIIRDMPSIAMLKHEDWPGLSKISRIRADEAAGQRRISILCGNAGLFLPEEIARGADGAMTGFGYPRMMVDVTRLAKSGEMDRAQDVFDTYLPLVRYESQPGLGLAVRKHVLARRGVIASAALRRPGAVLDKTAAAEVDRLIDRQEKKLEELS